MLLMALLHLLFENVCGKPRPAHRLFGETFLQGKDSQQSP